MYITDFGQSLVATCDDGTSLKVDRYAVWAWDPIKGRHQVVVTSDRLEWLQEMYPKAKKIITINTGAKP